MSQNYFSPKGKGVAQPSNEPDEADVAPETSTNCESIQNADRPGYMTVGNGPESERIAELRNMLENDSGYGGSIAGDEAFTHISQESSYVGQTGAIHQLWYNQHRGTLARAIIQVIDLLKDLQDKNVEWPLNYPSAQRATTTEPNRPPSRPGVQHSFSTTDNIPGTASSIPAPPLRRAMTSLRDQVEAESSKAAEKKVAETEPRLVTPQIAHDFSVLKLDLKMGNMHQTDLVHSLEKASIASLLDGKIRSSIKHLLALRERIEDTSSKVLVTGDLNAGKSTFCNALLRRKVLPEDQQPCTSIFCEVLDARENSNVEEVHAIPKNAIYNRSNESTYEVFTLQELDKIVTDNETYSQCKIYVKDSRTIDESLLNNGVVDIALIDAPGLNSDTTKTTAVFARQEEIDVVVFVVSAENHFTISAKDFIWAAAAEKAYLFIVVNRFDGIRDKDRCRKMILDQVAVMSPRTSKEQQELVHFVSSNAVPTAPGGPGGPGGSGSSSGGGGGDGPGDDKGKDKEAIADFRNLEQSLRRFVLEKRARSKLAPARTYLLNILADVNSLANVNADMAKEESDRMTQQLEDIEPQLESSRLAKSQVGEQIERNIEDTCKDVYDHTRSLLDAAITHSGDDTLGVPYPGLLSAFQYADDLKEAMLSQIAASVASCEDYAKTRAVSGVGAITQLGLRYAGDEYNQLHFRPDVMFKRRKDALARQVDITTELWDFVDWSTLLQRQEKVAGTGMALTLATAVGTQVVGGQAWVNHALSAAKIVGNDNLRRLIIPGVAVIGMARFSKPS
jgi:mitofusin 2